jgi:hypothetical protein
MKLLLTAPLLLVALAAGVLCERPAINPLTLAQPTDERFTGQVEERLEAGSYLYLRVRDGHEERWVATLRGTAAPSSTVAVHVFARSPRFQSRRLGRVFAPLSFGSVTTLTPELK